MPEGTRRVFTTLPLISHRDRERNARLAQGECLSSRVGQCVICWTVYAAQSALLRHPTGLVKGRVNVCVIRRKFRARRQV
jgi:hypothetical protein